MKKFVLHLLEHQWELTGNVESLNLLTNAVLQLLTCPCSAVLSRSLSLARWIL